MGRLTYILHILDIFPNIYSNFFKMTMFIREEFFKALLFAHKFRERLFLVCILLWMLLFWKIGVVHFLYLA